MFNEFLKWFTPLLYVTNYVPTVLQLYNISTFFKRFFIHLFFREKKRGIKKGKHLVSHWGPTLQLRHVSWVGIEPVTLWFAGLHSIHWATPARAQYSNFNSVIVFTSPPLLCCSPLISWKMMGHKSEGNQIWVSMVWHGLRNSEPFWISFLT